MCDGYIVFLGLQSLTGQKLSAVTSNTLIWRNRKYLDVFLQGPQNLSRWPRFGCPQMSCLPPWGSPWHSCLQLSGMPAGLGWGQRILGLEATLGHCRAVFQPGAGSRPGWCLCKVTCQSCSVLPGYFRVFRLEQIQDFTSRAWREISYRFHITFGEEQVVKERKQWS